MFIDTHAHLNFPNYKDSLQSVVDNSIKAGVEKIICVSSNVEDSQKAVQIASQFPNNVYAAVGIHPQITNPKNNPPINEQMEILEKLIGQNNVKAIGECGLDYSPAPPGETDRPKNEQILLFEKQIELALKYKLPLSVHTREAFQDTIEILKKYAGHGLMGVIHCYSAGRKGIAIVNGIGFHFGIDGNITYDEGLQGVIAGISLDKILLETDSPFLSPLPYRNLLNTPANVKMIAETLAKIKGTALSEIEKVTSDNAGRLFRLHG